jgi:molybdopterin converting factor small subunit
MNHEELNIFNQFTDRMKEELSANEHKGEWYLFKDRNLIVDEINHHFDKLQTALIQGDEELIKEYSADIANICMFMFNSTL